MRYRALFLHVVCVLGVVVGLLVCSLVYADIPRMINFQGRLTDASGKFVPDGNYSVTFRIYSVPSGGSALWTEAQLISCTKGLFNVILGTVTPIPNTIFDSYVDTYLGIQVGADPEMTPRQRLSSLGYAYYSLNADKLDGYHASDFTSPVSDFGRSGVSANLYEGTTTLTDKYVNVAGPDSVYSNSGTAFLGKASGSSTGDMIGVKGLTVNTSSGRAWGGYFGVSNAGTGYQHYGIVGYSESASDNVLYTSGVLGEGYASGTGYAAGIICLANNSSTGAAYGGNFTAYSGSGERYGIMATSYGSGSATTYGNYGYASNSSTGDAFGGYFTTSSSGTGEHYGALAIGNGSSSATTKGFAGYAYGSSTGSAVGVNGYAQNSSSGNAYGGWFETSSSGTGYHAGVISLCYGSSSTSDGVYSYASNTSSGNVYAGYFYASDAGTGTKYGVRAYASTAEGYAGYFTGNMTATGTKSAAVKVDNGEYRLLYAMESPENWFEDFGEGALVNGRALVQIDPMFAQSVNTSVKYHVFLTPQDEPLTLAVANRTANSFEVRGPAGSDISFSYRIVAKRKGYEDIRMAKMIGPTPEEEEAMQAKRIAESEREMAQMKRERIERTEEDELKHKPKEPQMESVQKPRREEPRPEDTEKMRAVSQQR